MLTIAMALAMSTSWGHFPNRHDQGAIPAWLFMQRFVHEQEGKVEDPTLGPDDCLSSLEPCTSLP